MGLDIKFSVLKDRKSLDEKVVIDMRSAHDVNDKALYIAKRDPSRVIEHQEGFLKLRLDYWSILEFECLFGQKDLNFKNTFLQMHTALFKEKDVYYSASW